MPATYSGTSGSPTSAGIWTVFVTVDSHDESARIVGDIRIDAEEDSARIAEFTLLPTLGTAFSVFDWVGRSVLIEIADMSSGSPASVKRLFTGIIDTPTLDLQSHTIALRCTDNLQQVIESMTLAAIEAEIPGSRYSPVVFDRAARGWSRSQDLLSTLPASLDMTPYAVLRLTDWAPLLVPDIVFDASHILDGSTSVTIAGASQLTNQVDIDFGYRYPRVKCDMYTVSEQYVDDTNFSVFVDDGNWFLQRAAVEAAIRSAGGTIESIAFTPLPNAAIGQWVPGPYDVELCMGFTAGVSFDFGQQVEETHTITVSAPNSITAVGTHRDRLSGALEGVYPSITAAESSALLWKNDYSGVPPQDVALPILGKTTSAEVSLTPETSRAAADEAIETLIEIAKVKIWASHRYNEVAASVPLNPSIDLDQTIEIDIPGLHARGKCRSLQHRMSPSTGEAVTDFALAICSVAGTGVTHADTPTAAPAGAPLTETDLLVDFATVDFNFGATEDHVITITFPGVEALERDLSEVPITANFSAPLVEDIFEVVL